MKGKSIVIAVCILLLIVTPLRSGARAEMPTIRIITFAQGFAWPELFGSNGTERTALLEQLEEEVGAKIEIEWGDETAVRQKVLTDLIARTGRYDIILTGSDGGVISF